MRLPDKITFTPLLGIAIDNCRERVVLIFSQSLFFGNILSWSKAGGII